MACDGVKLGRERYLGRRGASAGLLSLLSIAGTWLGIIQTRAAPPRCVPANSRLRISAVNGQAAMRVWDSVWQGLREYERSCVCRIAVSANEWLVGVEGGHRGVSANYRALEEVANGRGPQVVLYLRSCTERFD